MIKLNASLYLYICSAVLYVLSIIIQCEMLTLITKPIFIPAIIFYYFTQEENEFNYLFVKSLVFFFIGEMFFLINFKDCFFAGLSFLLFPNFIIIYFIYEDFRILMKTRNLKQLDVTLIMLSSILFYLLFNIFNLLEFDSIYEFLYFMIFGTSLLVMTVLTAILFIYSSYRKNTYLVFAVFSLLMAHLFLVLDMQFLNLLTFKYLNAFSQTIAYLFYTKYFLERSILENRLKTIDG